jgi:hypothetical protein
LVVAHGSTEEMAKAKTILEANNPTSIDHHEKVQGRTMDDAIPS